MPRSPHPRADPRRLADLARQLGTLLVELGLTEIEASAGDLKVRVQRIAEARVPPAAAVPSAPPLGVVDVTSKSVTAIEAPMVGTFYRAPSPGAAPYVSDGDLVKEGQTVCLIEAMKLMNEIETKVSGRVTKILAENAEPVEYGQPLILIDPHP